jgi:hypothetical protein
MFGVVCTTPECEQISDLRMADTPSKFDAVPNFSPLCFELENIAALIFCSKTPGY